MNQTQKIIKNFSLAFAVLLIVNIIGGIFYGIYGLLRIINFTKDNSQATHDYITNYENKNIVGIKMNLKSSSLVIKEGPYLKIETNNKNISTWQDKNRLVVKEKNHSWFTKNSNVEVILYVPGNMICDIVDIEAGAGSIEIEQLITKDLSLELGAGNLKIEHLNVLNVINIDGGAGKIEITAGTLNNLDLDLGVGKVNMNAEIIGNSKIESGVGSVDLNLLGNKDSYRIKTSKGLGSITIDGNDVTDDNIYGTGTNYLLIDGGVGSINIRFNK